MNDSDKNQFKVLMVGVGETYSKEISKPLLQIYFQSLKNHSIKAVSDAFTKHLICPKHGTFFPKPADLVRLLDADKPNIEEKASIAWLEVENSIRTVGSYGTLKLEDKQALATVKNMGGWLSICQCNESDLTWKRKEFIELYETFEKTPVDMLPQKLPGIEDLHNHKQESQQGMKSLMDGLDKFNKK